MAIVAGVDFGTLSVRVSIVDSERGLLASAVAEYPLHRKREDPDFATQSHDDHMRALAEATRQAVKSAGISGDQVESIALDTTGSSVIPVGEGLVPLDDYYLWCDHRAKQEAAQITELARLEKLEAIEWCGGVYSSEWGFAKLLHWLRHNPDKRDEVRQRLRALRHGRGHALRHHRRTPSEAQRLRHGPQVDVECHAGRPSSREFPGQSRSSARGCPGEARRRIRDLRQDCWHAVATVGGETWVRPAFRFRSEPSTPTGMRSEPARREGDVVNVVGTSTASSRTRRRRN